MIATIPDIPDTPLPDPDSLVEAVNPQNSQLVTWLIAIGLLVVGVLVASAASRGVARLLRRTQGDTAHVEKLLGRLVQAVIILLALVYALGAVGVRITPLLGALGIGGLAIAFAVQPALLNLFAGFLLHVHRPLRVGEEIRSGDVTGRVLDVTSRSTVIRSFSGETVYIPNSVVLDREIVNFVRSGQRRLTLTVGVAYGTDLTLARRVIADAAAEVEGVATSPGVEVFATEFGDSSINFEVDVWHQPGELARRRVRNRLVLALDQALAAADITIPFPQRTLWFGADQSAADATDADRPTDG